MKLGMWLRQTRDICLSTALLTVFLQLLVWFVEPGAATLKNSLPFYLLLAGVVLLLLSSVSGYKGLLPLVLSMGSTRFSARLGMQMMKLLPAAAISLANALLLRATGNGAVSWLAPVTLPVLLLAGAVGSLVGALSLRFEKLGIVLMTALFVLVGMGVGGSTIFALKGEAGNVISAVSKSLVPGPGMLWALAGIAATALAADWLVQGRILRGYEVKL